MKSISRAQLGRVGRRERQQGGVRQHEREAEAVKAASQDLGRWGEAVAERYLIGLGFEVIERNWSCREGELDLIVMRHGELSFVEVKTRASVAFGEPELAITADKARRLQRAAWRYLERTEQLERAWTIDVISIVCDNRRRIRRLDHYPNSIEAMDL